PLPDPRMAEIKLGQLLSFSAGIRGNNPVYVNGKSSKIDPVGPDGWYSIVDQYSLGIKDGTMGNVPFTAKTLWCEPGGGYSYASASIHNASIMLRYVSGMELADYIDSHLAGPLGWGRWGFGYKNQPLVNHTPGAGGIALRSTDMLRFCYLLLHEGRWGQQQIVPKEYIQKATKTSPYNPHYPYSLQFNVNSGGEIRELPRDAYWKFGSGGHCFCVVPSLDLIIWKLGGRDGQYSSADTGLPEPLYPSVVIKPINDGQVHDADIDNIKMMIMVISSILDEKK
ncbi:MAG: serine hydrolase, partial [Bacteroidales bacterium]|nr:serine hydrolase [Bacteroidales bacterium]